ncbi:MAG: alpha-amylase family glycosyl hydrolase [Phycisphaerales bacterium JB059]
MRARTMLLAGTLTLSPGLALGGEEASPDAWWHEAVFYHAFVRSFADSTTGPLAGDGIGDLRGMIERLDYLNDGDPETDTDLGVTAIWLMPIFESPSYHGYDVTDYKKIEPDYGTNEDFRELVEACHARGIRVILDMVINHCSWEHPWFRESVDPDSPKHDWFVWEQVPPTGEGAPEHSVWHDQFREENGLLYYGWFWHGMPDFNARSQGATEAIYDLSRYWLEEMNADGYRLDAIKHLIEDGVVWANTDETFEWLEQYNAYLKSVNPECFTVGEIWDDTDVVMRYIPNSVDSAFEFTTCFATAEALNTERAAPIATALQNAWDAYDRGLYASFIGNHDMDRVRSRLGGSEAQSEAKCRAAATIHLTSPGVPFIYYGQEIGMVGVKPDPDLRTPMQWTGDPERTGFTTGTPWRAVNPDAPEVNIERQAKEPGSLLRLYKRLIRLRQDSPALSRGSFELVETGDERVLAYVREAEGQRVLVIVNVSGEEIREGWGVNAGGLVVEGGDGLRELANAAPTYAPGSERAWRPLGGLRPYTGYVIELAR